MTTGSMHFPGTESTSPAPGTTGKMHFPTGMESEIIWANNVEITKAKITITGTLGSGGQLILSLGTSPTWEGTYTWEEVTNGIVTNEEYNFTYVVGKFMKWRMLGSNATVTNLSILVNEEV